jgi:hypothetical protein
LRSKAERLQGKTERFTGEAERSAKRLGLVEAAGFSPLLVDRCKRPSGLGSLSQQPEGDS